LDEPSKKRVTSFDVARHAGVSRSAVSRAFSENAVISDATRKKVLEAAKELGYSVNFMARSLQTRHSNLVGIVVSALDTPFRARQVKIAAQEFVRQGFRPILMNAETPEEVEKLSAQLFNYNVAGILVTSATPSSAIISECNRLSIPIVLVNRGSQIEGVDNIQMDTQQAGQLAFDMLVQSGAKNLAVVHPQITSYSVTGRATAFVTACKFAEIPVTEFLAPGQTYTAGAAITDQITRTKQQIDGIFCSTDTLAFGVMDELRHTHSISIPNDIQIIGCDDVEQASWSSYQLSTIRQDSTEQSITAVEMMLKRIKYPTQQGQTIVQPVSPVYRATTRHNK